MPQIPRLTQNQVGPAPLQIAPRQAAPSGLQALGVAIQETAGVLFEVQQREREKADRAAFSEADRKLSELSTRTLYDPKTGAAARLGKNAFGLPQQILPEFDKGAVEIEGALTTPRQKAAYRERLNDVRSGMLRDLQVHELKQRDVHYDATDEARIDTSVQAAALSGQPEKIENELVTQRATISGMARRKGWDETQAVVAQREAESKTHEAVIGHFLAKDQFGKATSYLASHASRMNDPAVESLQRRILIEEDSILRRQQHQQKLNADAVAKNGDKLFAQGQLTSAWIEAHRNSLDAQDYRYFYGKLTGNGEGPRDSLIYADLRDAAGRGEDVRADAREALRRGQIRSSDWDRITSEVEQQRPGWYKRGMQYIKVSSAVSDLNPDPAASQRLAAMQDDFDNWARENPKATDTEGQAAYKRITDEYAIIHLKNITITKRAPSFLVGGRMTPDIDASEVATVKAFKEGRIGEAEFNRQAVLLKEWREALAAQPKPKKPAQ